MKRETVCIPRDADFKRAVGVQRDIFDELMLEEIKNIRDFGRPPKLSWTDRFLMTLIADFETGKIISSDFCGGGTHDFKLFKES